MAVEAARIVIDIDSDPRTANANLNKIDRGLKKVDRSTKQLDSDTKKYARTARTSFNTARTAYLGYAAAIGIGIAAFSAVINATRVQVEANTRLRAVLRSTGEAAGLTYEQLKEMASGLQSVTTFGDEAINNAQSLLLTFTSIGQDVFPTALESILNVSTAMGQDLQQSVQQVGRALNDPIKGVAALTRVGVQFTDQQKQQIRTMQQAGDIAGAQRVILGELETQFGGLARAMARTPFGRLEQLKNTLGDMAETIGEGLLPDLGRLAEALNTATESGSGMQTVFEGIGRFFGGFLGQIATVIENIKTLSDVLRGNINLATLAQRQQQQIIGSTLVERGQARKARLAAKEGRTPPTPPGATPPRQTGGGGGTAIDQLRADEERFRQEQIQAEQDHIARFKDLQIAKVEAERRANEERLQNARDTFDAIAGLASTVVGGLSEVFKMAEQNQIQSVQNVFNRRKDLIEQNVTDETRKAELLEQLETQTEARLSSIRKDAAEKQKALAIFTATIETAKGAISAFSSAMSLPYPANLIIGGITAAAVTALGAAKIALISGTPTPSAQFGGEFIVPPGNPADSATLNVNQGERVRVEPVRSTNNGMPKTMILRIGDTEFRAVVEEIVDDSLNNGNVQINRKGAVKSA